MSSFRTSARAAGISRRLGAWVLVLLGLGSAALQAQDARVPPPSPVEAYGRLAVSFEPNMGQADPRVKFLSRGRGQTLFLTSNEVIAVLERSRSGNTRTGVVLRIELLNANRRATVTGQDETPGRTNYFFGKDPAKWRSGVPAYSKVLYRNVYPGIDAVYYGHGRSLEYDFVVAPGADPRRIRFAIRGAEKIALNERGDAVLHVEGAEVLLERPRLYQTVDGTRREVAGEYVLDGDELRFRIGAYDRRRSLVIDPVLAYSTYLGGSEGDRGMAVAVDGSGHAYVAGHTMSPDLPVSSGAFQSTLTGAGAAFVAKFDPTQSGAASRIYTTYLGDGSGATGIAVDSAGNAYVLGVTNALNFPVTPTAFQAGLSSSNDIVLTKLNSSGTALLYSTYLGGINDDYPNGIALDGSGNAYITGYAQSTDFPVTPNAFQVTHPNGVQAAFVAKIDPSQSGAASLVYSTYLGGSNVDLGYAIAVDAGGHAYVTGHTASLNFPTQNPLQPTCNGCVATACGANCSGPRDAFVTKLSQAGNALVYSTFLGGSDPEDGHGIAVDAAGNVYVTGQTTSADFPLTASAFQSIYRLSSDAFVTKISANGATLLYSTYLGGGAADVASGIAVDAAGAALVVGSTTSANFPVTADAFKTALGSNGGDAFVAKVDPSRTGGASLIYSTYLGGTGVEGDLFRDAGIAVDAAGNAYVAGFTASADFPVTPTSGHPGAPAAFQPASGGNADAFLVKITDCAAPSGIWTATGSLPAGRTGHTSTRLADGRVLITGGFDSAQDPQSLATAVVYDPATGAYAATGSMGTARAYHSATLLTDGRVLVAGGVLVFGTGIFAQHVCLSSAELFDPAANNGAGAFAPAGSLQAFRDSHTATLLPNGKVLLTGGACAGGASAELYDPAANNGAGVSADTGWMSVVRVGHTATLLPNGTVLVAGGADTTGPLAAHTSAEIYDPAAGGGAGAFALAGNMTTGRYGHQAALLPSGSVLVVGGLDANVTSLSSAEVFSPSSGMFTPAGPMAVTRSGHTATRLANGQILVAGGLTAGGTFLNSAELFDETTLAFAPTGQMGTTRYQHSATLLPNGDVLVAGGRENGPTLLLASELYSPMECGPFNTSAGTNVTVTPIDPTSGTTPATVTFSSVSQPGRTTVTTNGTGPALPPNFELGNGLYYHIETTATYSGAITICIDYSGTSLAGTTTQPSFGHYDSATGLWTIVTATSWDQANDIICGTVMSLSPFALLVSEQTAGEMTGAGHIDSDGRWRHSFQFRVAASESGSERGWLRYSVSAPRSAPNRFESTIIGTVAFADGVATFWGQGEWNGLAGYTFEARAADIDEPGRGRDTFAITIRDSVGHVVATLTGALAGGNIQMHRRPAP